MQLHATLTPRVLTAQGARRLGISRQRIRTELVNGHWQRLTQGVWLTRVDPPDRLDWALAGLAIGGAQAALTGWDAARLRGLGPKQPVVPVVRVLTSSGGNRRLGDVRLRPSTRPLNTAVFASDRDPDGIRVVSTARAIADTALDAASRTAVRAMITAAVQRGLCTQDELVTELEHAPRNGSGHLRAALEDVRGGARSIAEAEAIDLLRRPDIPRFEANAEIRDSTGRVVAVADVLWRSLRAILEIDSREFHFGEQEWKQTMRRHNRLTSLGYAVAHYPPSAIRTRRERWADEVSAWLTKRAAELGVRAS
jgi:hypothetical protein